MSVLVADIPTSTWTGPRAVTSPDGKGVLQIYNSNVYEMKCDATSCTWETWSQGFTSGLNRNEWFQAIYIFLQNLPLVVRYWNIDW